MRIKLFQGLTQAVYVFIIHIEHLTRTMWFQEIGPKDDKKANIRCEVGLERFIHILQWYLIHECMYMDH